MADSNKPYGNVTYADPKNGKYPIDTEEHARAAWSYINQSKNAAMYPLNGVTLSEVKDRIKAACKKFGIDISDDSGSSRASLGPFRRSFPLEDISIRSGGGGRTVEAYAAVFNSPTEVKDHDGHYMEELDPAVFNKAISDAAPQGSRRNWRIGVFYNHGLTIMGTPSDQNSVPIGKIVDIKADDRGLWTEIQYNRTRLADEVLENIREGSITGYSFSGNFRRSNPMVPGGGFRPNYRTGELPKVRRYESTLKELGPTPFPYYQDAEVVGMRAEQLLTAMASNPELAMRMITMMSGGTSEEPPPEAGTPDPEPPPRSRALVHSGRSVKQEIDAARADFLLRYRR